MDCHGLLRYDVMNTTWHHSWSRPQRLCVPLYPRPIWGKKQALSSQPTLDNGICKLLRKFREPNGSEPFSEYLRQKKIALCWQSLPVIWTGDILHVFVVSRSRHHGDYTDSASALTTTCPSDVDLASRWSTKPCSSNVDIASRWRFIGSNLGVSYFRQQTEVPPMRSV